MTHEQMIERMENMIERLAAARDTALARVAVLEAALRTLVDRLEFIHGHEAFRSVWTLSQLHGAPYTGPTYEAELRRAREALKGSAS